MRGNKTVIFLPLIVMLGLFTFGYFSLNQTGGFSNTELQDNIEITYEPGELHLIDWQWGSFPEDGVAGNDYMELVMTSPEVESSVLRLQQAGETLYETSDWFETQDGIAVEFPTYEDGEQIIGALGHWEFAAEGQINAVRYYHTWTPEELEVSDNPDLQAVMEDAVPEHHWVVETELD